MRKYCKKFNSLSRPQNHNFLPFFFFVHFFHFVFLLWSNLSRRCAENAEKITLYSPSNVCATASHNRDKLVLQDYEASPHASATPRMWVENFSPPPFSRFFSTAAQKRQEKFLELARAVLTEILRPLLLSACIISIGTRGRASVLLGQGIKCREKFSALWANASECYDSIYEMYTELYPTRGSANTTGRNTFSLLSLSNYTRKRDTHAT